MCEVTVVILHRLQKRELNRECFNQRLPSHIPSSCVRSRNLQTLLDSGSNPSQIPSYSGYLWLHGDSDTKHTDTCTLSCVICHYVSTAYCFKTRAGMSSQPSSTWAVNMSWGMSDRSSEVSAKHALAGTEGHSHLVIWVNYKWGKPQRGKMSWTAVSPDTHTNTHTLRIIAHMHGPLHWAPDPRGRPWLKSPLPQPGETGEKFTITAAKLFFTLFHSLCLLEPPMEIQEEVCVLDLSTVILWYSHDHSDSRYTSVGQRNCSFIMCSTLLIGWWNAQSGNQCTKGEINIINVLCGSNIPRPDATPPCPCTTYY